MLALGSSARCLLAPKAPLATPNATLLTSTISTLKPVRMCASTFLSILPFGAVSRCVKGLRLRKAFWCASVAHV